MEIALKYLDHICIMLNKCKEGHSMEIVTICLVLKQFTIYGSGCVENLISATDLPFCHKSDITNGCEACIMVYLRSTII